jgi:hypothetical protein
MHVSLSVVVVVFDMQRELPRTLRTLDPRFQRGIAADDYEVIVVDNGSAEPIAESVFDGFSGRIRTLRLESAPPSPARAANRGIALAEGRLVGLIVDGARMASPGLLGGAQRGARLAERPVITSPGFHLGPTRHSEAEEAGYDGRAEDTLLAELDWEIDGYRLFEISTPAHSSARGLFGAMGESSALFMPAVMWQELGGLDEAFALPGGGLVNHDTYRRACSLDGAQLVVLLGEGTFHQVHGGIATSGRLTRDEMRSEYERLRGVPYRPPTNEALYVGTVPDSALRYIESSAQLAARRRSGHDGSPRG